MDYRLATDEEVKLLEPIFKQNGASVPDPLFSRVAIAVDTNGNIRGFLVLQLQYHLEPLWIDQAATGQVDFLELQKKIETLFTENSVHPNPFAFTTDKRMDDIMKKGGFDEFPVYKVWRKTL